MAIPNPGVLAESLGVDLGGDDQWVSFRAIHERQEATGRRG